MSSSFFFFLLVNNVDVAINSNLIGSICLDLKAFEIVLTVTDRLKTSLLSKLSSSSLRFVLRFVLTTYIFCSYFKEVNNHLFETLLQVSSSPSKMITEDIMTSLCLHPVKDRQFLVDLLEVYNIDALLFEQQSCCNL